MFYLWAKDYTQLDTKHEHGYFIAVLHYVNNVTCHSCDWFFWRIFPFRLYTRIFFFQSVGRLTEFLPYLTGHCCSSHFFSLLFCQKDFCPVFSITCKCKIKLLSMWSKSRSLLNSNNEKQNYVFSENTNLDVFYIVWKCVLMILHLLINNAWSSNVNFEVLWHFLLFWNAFRVSPIPFQNLFA